MALLFSRVGRCLTATSARNHGDGAQAHQSQAQVHPRAPRVPCSPRSADMGTKSHRPRGDYRGSYLYMNRTVP